MTKQRKMTTLEMELALVNYFDHVQNLIVPNVHWGFSFNHECDLLIMTKAGYLWEVEIKISRADLIRDKQKRHCHIDYRGRIKFLYFAIPDYLEKDIEHIPDYAGIIRVKPYLYGGREYFNCQIIKKPQYNNNSYKLNDAEKYKLARLGAIRIWSLKNKIQKLANTRNKKRRK